MEEESDPQFSPGDRMADGTKYAGISPDTGKAMYVTPADAPLTCMFNEAGDYAKGLNKQKAHGHDDWRVPTKGELNELFKNRAAIGGFNTANSYPAGWYWSSMADGDSSSAWEQRFGDGRQFIGGKYNASSVRLVR